MLTAQDIRGVCPLPPTPCKEGSGGWDATDSVDLEETATMVEKLIRDGVGSIGLCGTTGECAALLWDEKRKFVDTAVHVARQRVPIFAGATALGTKEVIRQMRGLKDVGADGVLVGLPLWQTPTLEDAVRFYADLSEAVPDMPIMIYSNSRFFKYNFPTPFWEGVARRAPTVVCTKVTYGTDHLLDDIRVAGHQINFITGETMVYAAFKMAPDRVTAVWATSAGMGPEPWVALMEAIDKRDDQRFEEIWQDIRAVPHYTPREDLTGGPNDGISRYNAQGERWRCNAAGYIHAGPMRSPYTDLPDRYKQHADLCAQRWTEIRKKYAKTPAS